jgi:hypothetical protein
MENTLIKQWADTIKASVDSFKKFTNSNIDAMNMVTENLFKIKDFSELGKTIMNASSELRTTNESVTNKSLHAQLSMIDLKSSATAIKDLSAITTDSMNRLMKSQTDMLNIYMENIANYLETLKRSRSTTDITTAQLHLFTELQAKMKDNAIETLSLMEGIKTAMNALTEKTLDNMGAESTGEK